MAALCAAMLGLLTPACSAPKRPSIVLITIDTLRADHLGCYGYQRDVSPHIDAFARQSTLFEQARTTLPRTTQAVSSILTGRLPKSHGARGIFAHLSEGNTTIAEALKSAGFDTAAFVSNTFLHPRQGFSQGFDVYDNPEERWSGDSANSVTGSAAHWLDERKSDKPFFLWVHYVDPHWLYAPPRPWDQSFGPGFDGLLAVYNELNGGKVTQGQIIFGNVIDPSQESRYMALYDGEIGYTDAAIGALLGRLDAVDGPVITVLAADHGEGLGEHGYHYGHGEYLYEDGLHIPLIVRYPGVVAAGARERGAVLNIDIAPTILALADLPALERVEGRPVLTLGGRGSLARVSPGRTITWAESDYQLIHPENERYYIPGPQGRWTSTSDGRYKLIHIPRPGGEILELYDLEADPGEKVNRAADPALAEVRARLMRDLLAFADYGPSAGTPESTALPGDENSTEERRGAFERDPNDPTRELSQDEIERLRGLGYIN
ncbi:MAG TPA: sulfatase [Dongiaceae bacterium]|nr:sulfatase [Dongiaceae bacterium]